MGLRSLVDERLELVDGAADAGKATLPERNAPDVDAERRGEGFGVRHAGSGEKRVVALREAGGILLVASVEAETEEEAEGVGIVVEGGAVVVALHRPHVGVEGGFI